MIKGSGQSFCGSVDGSCIDDTDLMYNNVRTMLNIGNRFAQCIAQAYIEGDDKQKQKLVAYFFTEFNQYEGSI